MGQRIDRRLQDILQTHRPEPLPDHMLSQFDGILHAAIARSPNWEVDPHAG
jgi:hypothetical protein